MIVVDTSAWLELFRGTGSPTHLRLRAAIEAKEPVAVTEVVVAELLAGKTTYRETRELRGMLLMFTVLPLHGLAGYEHAARLARTCRRRGETVRGITDCLVAVPAIEAGAPVLHRDRDFDVLARHTDLQVVPVG